MQPSIVINREYGSGGREVGRLISERTGMRFYDTLILQEAASRRGLPADLLSSFDERIATGQFFDLSIIGGSDPETYSLPFRMYAAIAEVVTEAAQTAPAVFIGRCADQILRDANLRFRNVFIYSTDLEQKIERAVEDGVARKDAERHIARMEGPRALPAVPHRDATGRLPHLRPVPEHRSPGLRDVRRHHPGRGRRRPVLSDPGTARSLPRASRMAP